MVGYGGGSRWFIPMVMAICMAASSAGAADSIGIVKTVINSATVEREGVVAVLEVGSNVQAEDVLSTGPDGSLGVTFRDDSTLSMGPRGRLVLDSFAFDPAAENLGMGLGFLKGTFAVVSGQIAKLSPESFKVRTPTMMIGIRGTSFLVEVEGDD